MNGTTTLIFATRNDYLELSKLLDSKLSLIYAKSGYFTVDQTEIYASISMLPDLGTCSSGDWVHANRYIVGKPDFRITHEVITPRKGGTRFIFDISSNPSAFNFVSGGQYDDNTLICGGISRATGNLEATGNYNTFRRLMGKVFRRVDGAYVGSEANAMLLNGMRLVQRYRQPVTSDLRPAR